MRTFFQARWLSSFYTWMLYWMGITALFLLPGSALPKTNWLTNIYFDKWVHIGFFAALLFLTLSVWKMFRHRKKLLLLLAVLYGLLIELVQDRFVANRDFDGYDLMADAVGSVVGLLFWLWVYKKNKPL